MAATPQYGTAIFRGMSGRKYIKDFYVSDINSALFRWDAGGGASATSPTDWRPPEPVVLVDLSIVTGCIDTSKAVLTRNGMPTGDIIRYTIFLTTLANRPTLNIPYLAGDQVTAMQMT